MSTTTNDHLKYVSALKYVEALERITKLETALQLIVDYPGTKGVMLKRFIAVAQKALEQEN
jgi:rRNA processing protein Krr1/Pno1